MTPLCEADVIDIFVHTHNAFESLLRLLVCYYDIKPGEKWLINRLAGCFLCSLLCDNKLKCPFPYIVTAGGDVIM